MPEKTPPVICKSIFKDGKNTPSRESFTRVWINLINRMEKSRRDLTGV